MQVILSEIIIVLTRLDYCCYYYCMETVRRMQEGLKSRVFGSFGVMLTPEILIPYVDSVIQNKLGQAIHDNLNECTVEELRYLRRMLTNEQSTADTRVKEIPAGADDGGSETSVRSSNKRASRGSR